MLQSSLFTKTRREPPQDEVAKNAELLIRGGFVAKEVAGAYSYLPLGLRVLENIVRVIREEMNALGGQEVHLTALQDPGVWGTTDRWDDEKVDIWFKTKLKGGGELGLSFTHEEPLTNLMRSFVSSYRDLPRLVYQFQTKFRNETRAKSGILRGREFLMKDLYSFAATEEEHAAIYEKVKDAYIRIFERVGIGASTYVTFASGGSFSKYSHEFQTVCEAGEDTIYVDDDKRIAVNEEVLTDDVLADLGLSRGNLVPKKAVEAGNIFNLGTRFSDAFDLSFTDAGGKKRSVIMGSYGIGPGRLMGTIVELFADEKGIVWPESVAPFRVHLIELESDGKVRDEAKRLYGALTKAGIETLYDDRDARAGEKFADSDLIGIPHRVVVSEKSLAGGGFEYKARARGETSILSYEEILKKFHA